MKSRSNHLFVLGWAGLAAEASCVLSIWPLMLMTLEEHELHVNAFRIHTSARFCQFVQIIRLVYRPMLRRGSTRSHSMHSAISAPSTISVWMIPSRLFPLLTAFTQQLWSPSVKWVSVPSSTNSPCRCKHIHSHTFQTAHTYWRNPLSHIRSLDSYNCSDLNAFDYNFEKCFYHHSYILISIYSIGVRLHRWLYVCMSAVCMTKNIKMNQNSH